MERGSASGKATTQKRKREEAVTTKEEALRILLDGAAGLSEEAVRALIEEYLAKIRPAPVEVLIRKGETVTKVEGQHRCFPRLVTAIGLRDEVCLVGPTGTGKSYSAKVAAKALGLAYHELPVGPTTVESKLLGSHTATGGTIRTEFREAYEHGGVFLLDEADNGSGAVTAVANNALANGHCAFPDRIVERHPDFVFIAACNTIGLGATKEFAGRQGMDRALRDRLTFIDWPIDEAIEEGVAMSIGGGLGLEESRTREWIDRIRAVRKGVKASGQMAVEASPRSTYKGVKYLASGWTNSEVEDSVLWKGVSQAIRQKVEEGAK